MNKPKNWTPDGWKVFGNTNIWKLEEVIKEDYELHYADAAHKSASEQILFWTGEFIDAEEAKYLELYNDKCYEEAVYNPEKKEVLFG